MKRFVLAVVLMLFLYSPANATMVVLENGLLFDKNTGYVWNLDLSAYYGMTYSDQLAAISGTSTFYDVNKNGVLDELLWEFASFDLVVGLVQYCGFGIEQQPPYSSGHIDGVLWSPSYETQFFFNQLRTANDPEYTRDGSLWYARFANGGELAFSNVVINDIERYTFIIEAAEYVAPEFLNELSRSAWAVASVNYATPIPEPSTILLFCCGIIGIITTLMPKIRPSC